MLKQPSSQRSPDHPQPAPWVADVASELAASERAMHVEQRWLLDTLGAANLVAAFVAVTLIGLPLLWTMFSVCFTTEAPSAWDRLDDAVLAVFLLPHSAILWVLTLALAALVTGGRRLLRRCMPHRLRRPRPSDPLDHLC